MKLNPLLLILAITPALSWAVSAHAASCVNDIDCTAGGMACGSEICSWPSGKICVAATGAPAADSWCGGNYGSGETQAQANAQCKCHALGATCNLATYHCSFFEPPDAGSGRGSSSGSSSGSSTTTPDGGSSSSGSSGGSSMEPDGGSIGSASSGGSSAEPMDGSGNGSNSVEPEAGTSEMTGGGSEAGPGGTGTSSNSPSADGGTSGAMPGQSSACAVGIGPSDSPWTLGAVALGVFFAVTRRRRNT
jgi:MYXO-CTERM domain-containing protein